MDNILENDGQNAAALEQAIKEAVDDETFRKVTKRMSYSGGTAEEVSTLTNNSQIIWKPGIYLKKQLCYLFGNQCDTYQWIIFEGYRAKM